MRQSILCTNKLFWLTLLLSSFVTTAVQAATLDYSALEALIKSGQSQQAYEQMLASRDELEGDASFDFYYGLAAIESGRVSEGVFALERVVANFPDDGRARVELARGYFLLEEDGRARQEFNIVLDQNPPDAVVANVQRFLNIIRLRESRYRSTSSAYIEVAVGADSNINGAPASASFISPILGPLTLGGGSVQDADTFRKLSLGGQLRHPYAPGRQLFIGIDFVARRHSNDNDFETNTWNVYGGVSIREGDNTWKITGRLQEFEVGEADNRNFVSLTGEWNRHLDKNTQWTNSLLIGQFDYPGQPIRNSTLFNLSTGLSHNYQVKLRPSVAANVFVGYENTHSGADVARALAGRRFFGLRLAGQIIPMPRMSIYTSLLAQNSHYEQEDIFLGKTRNDVLFQSAIGMKYLIDQDWSFRFDYTYTRNDSNMAVNDYDRKQTQLSLRYAF